MVKKPVAGRRGPVVRKMQTEYQRMDIDPRPAGRSLLHDRNGMPRVAQPKSRAARPMPEISNEPIRIPAKKEEDVSYHRVPKQPMAHIGMHEDTMWFDEELVAGEVPGHSPPEDVIDNNEEIDVESLQRPDSARDEELRRAPKETWADRIETHQPQEPEAEPEQTVEEIEQLGFDLERGEYAVLMNGQLIVKYDDLDYVKRVVEDMILNHDIEVSAITVIKSIPIDFGVLLG
jgi:hypothetical protein